MSRSRKKHPIGAICCIGRKAIRSAKRLAGKKIRMLKDEDLPDGNTFKKVYGRWDWPDDGKKWHTHEKAYRK